MCGIAGKYYFGADRLVDPGVIEAMTDIMSYRGPDDSGLYTQRNIGLGHRRLSILDLSAAGHQPMCNENGKVWVIFNGEIYNYKSLRSDLEGKGHVFRSNTDTEVIVHAYEDDPLVLYSNSAACLLLLSGTRIANAWYWPEISSESNHSTILLTVNSSVLLLKLKGY